MVFTESVKFVASTVLFMRTFIKVVLSYLDEKSPQPRDLKGVGLHQQKLPENLPSIIEIKRALPKQCFQRKLSTSLFYAVLDFVRIAITYVVITYLHEIPSFPVKAVTMVLYWAVQGTFFTSVFVVGHDCGHASFCDYPVIDDIVGTIMHAFLLCPYYMWKLSHRNHHKNNANLDKDEVFYPVRKSESCSKDKALPGFGFGVGWFGYLALGYKPRPVNHFKPSEPMFAGHRFGCWCSLASLGVMSYLLYLYYSAYGFWPLVCYYAVPVFIFASYCVIITFLHHTEMNVPWFADDQWDFVKGQLSTIDRHYGIVHYVIHSIGTHQMHHMFTKIPHYHLEEATRHFRQAFPDLVRVCDEPILPSFMRMYKKYEEQSAIDDESKVYYYK